ncbi:MAG: DMT family transporter, partial [Candidatus Caldatribacteriaceae bacterium]
LMRFAVGTVFFLLLAKKPLLSYRMLIAALFNGALFVTMVNIAVNLTANPALASSLVYAQPLFVMLISISLYRERLHPLQVAGTLLAFLGILTAVGSVRFDAGALLAVCAGFIWAVGILYYKRNMASENMFCFNASVNLFSALLVMPVVFALRDGLAIPLEGVAWGLLLALVAQVIGFWLWFVSVRDLGPVIAGAISLLVPVVAYFFTYLLMGKIPTVLQLLGSLLTLSGVFLAQAFNRKPLPIED